MDSQLNAGSRNSGQGTNEFSFSEGKMAAIGGRPLPTPDDSSSNDGDGLGFGQSKLEGIGGRSLPKPDQGASTLEGDSADNSANVDTFGKFPN